MEVVVLILKIFVIVEVAIMLVYTVRHFLFTLNRVLGEQRIYYHDIVDSDLPAVTVIVPMHNEEKVAADILDHLIREEYPADRFEIIVIDDHSEDDTAEIIDRYALEYPHLVKPFHRDSGERGKTHGLNEALDMANGEIIAVFDADYIPASGILRDIVVCFKDPEVGAVMGRVVPKNTGASLLTRLLDLERSGGYQVDQQARHNMRLIPQYGGTVGGFRKDLVVSMGGFNSRILTEDTELTFLLFVNGWKVVYANRAECYEESPESWEVRARQITRWARGHTQVMFKYLMPLLRSPHLSRKEKMDGLLLMGIFMIPPLILLGIPVALALFFLGEMQIVDAILIFLFVAAYNSFGNFAPFFQIGTASFLDGTRDRVKLLPIFFFSFIFNLLYVSRGSVAAIGDVILRRKPEWEKTKRFRKEEKVA